MKRKPGWNRMSRTAAITVLLCSLFLAGCGNGAEGNERPPVETTGEPEESAVLTSSEEDAEEQETAGGSKEEPSGQFRYDYNKLYGELPPVVGEKQAKEEGRHILTLQASVASSWLSYSVKRFNSQNTTYYISLQESGFGEPLGDCRTRMMMELVAGRGPDIFIGDVFPVNESILDKGIVVDLAPGLDAMGITDEEYFPAVRALCVGDRVYGLRPIAWPEEFWIRESVLGGREIPDIETLVEKIYAYPDQKAVWYPYVTSVLILDYLLGGSENLWGMIDWETGRCDFSGDLFAKMLEIAKRYADPEGKGEEGIVDFYDPASLVSVEHKQLESEGKVFINFFFDDGCYPRYRPSSALMLNANSEYLEGAWEFLEYLLGEEGQGYAAEAMGAVNKEMFDSYAEFELSLVEAGRSTATLTEKTVEEARDCAERARYFPTRTNEIREIIYEDAEAFFNGDKTREAVCDLIQNRVQMYLNEHQ